MTEWTVNRLDALPEGTVIGYSMNRITRSKDMNVRLHKFRGAWVNPGGLRVLPKDILDFTDPGSLRVVSVPIDALMADETVRAIARAMSDDWNPDRDPVLTAMFQDYAQTAARAAVEHVTGGAR